MQHGIGLYIRPVSRLMSSGTDFQTPRAVKPLRSAVQTAYCRTATSALCHDKCEAELKPLDGEYNHGDEDNHMQYYRKKTGMRTDEQIEQIARFYPEFDAWLAEIRGGKSTCVPVDEPAERDDKLKEE